MNHDRAYRSHLSGPADLVTSYEATRAGFVSLALEKNRIAEPLVDQARKLLALASGVGCPADLLGIDGIRPSLVAAAGLSDKACAHVQPADENQAIAKLIQEFLEPAGPKFPEELVFRFLLTRGDTLGGMLRNVAGAVAEQKLSRAVISTLTLAGATYRFQRKGHRQWIPRPKQDAGLESSLKGLSWESPKGPRTLIFNTRLKIAGKNVDLCLLAVEPEDMAEARDAPASYVALGELKGGIDPQGSDEHWKTADTALDRVRQAFQQAGNHHPALFFVGAAIVPAVAKNIWTDLLNGNLANAANLTEDAQMAHFCRWLCAL